MAKDTCASEARDRCHHSLVFSQLGGKEMLMLWTLTTPSRCDCSRWRLEAHESKRQAAFARLGLALLRHCTPTLLDVILLARSSHPLLACLCSRAFSHYTAAASTLQMSMTCSYTREELLDHMGHMEGRRMDKE